MSRDEARQILGVLAWVLAVGIGVLWACVPFAVFAIKRRLDKIARILEKD